MRPIDADNLLKGIEELKESPWFNRGKLEKTDTNVDYNLSLYHIGYLERKEAVEIIVDMCIKKEPTVGVEPVNGWISVDEHQPDSIGDEILMYGTNKEMTTGYYDYGEWICDAPIGEVTHWQYLPKPPKEDKDG